MMKKFLFFPLAICFLGIAFYLSNNIPVRAESSSISNPEIAKLKQIISALIDQVGFLMRQLEAIKKSTTPKTASVSAISPLLVTAGVSNLAGQVGVSLSSLTKDFYVMYPSKYFGASGEKILIYGSGFAALASSNTVYIGGNSIKAVESGVPGAIAFEVPKNISYGKHDLSVSNGVKTSAKTFFIVTDPKLSVPVISNASLKEGFSGSTVTLTGSGFSFAGNSVMLGFANVENVSSPDGKKLAFILPAMSAQGTLSAIPSENEPLGNSVSSQTNPLSQGSVSSVGFPIKIYVANNGGISEGLDFKLLQNN